jgi:ribosomal protein S18 acetylase RimI-like enzyme
MSEIDVSESGDVLYEVVDGKLVARAQHHERPHLTADDWQHDVEWWKSMLQADGTAIGAFDGNALVGLIVLRYHLTPDMAQLAALYVGKAYRRQGIANQLTQEVIRLAREHGARQLYVSATPSESAVGFYQSQGFTLTEHPDPHLFALEPKDIHMIRPL